MGLQQRKRRSVFPAPLREPVSLRVSAPPRDLFPCSLPITEPTPSAAPSGACSPSHRVPRLTPWATFCRCSAPPGGITGMAMDATFRCGSGSKERLCRRSPKAWAHPSTQGHPNTPDPHPTYSPRRCVAVGKQSVRVSAASRKREGHGSGLTPTTSTSPTAPFDPDSDPDPELKPDVETRIVRASRPPGSEAGPAHHPRPIPNPIAASPCRRWKTVCPRRRWPPRRWRRRHRFPNRTNAAAAASMDSVKPHRTWTPSR